MVKAAYMHRNCLLPAADDLGVERRPVALRLNGMEQAPAPSSRSHRHRLRWPMNSLSRPSGMRRIPGAASNRSTPSSSCLRVMLLAQMLWSPGQGVVGGSGRFSVVRNHQSENLCHLVCSNS